jgi:hypothetical protein
VRRELVGILDQIQRMAVGGEGPAIEQRGRSIEENIKL